MKKQKKNQRKSSKVNFLEKSLIKKRKEKIPRLAIRFNLKKVLSKEIRLGSKVPEALDKKISDVLKAAAERAKENHRSTILPQDL